MAIAARGGLIDLSHDITEGMVTYKGLPGPHLCDCWSRAETAANYDDGATFQIGRIDMIANTGTYLDTPFHRFEDGDDLAGVGIERVAGLPGVLVRSSDMAVDVAAFGEVEVAGRAVLVATGWDRHWGSDAYFTGHPFLPSPQQTISSSKAQRWSESTVTISTTRAVARGECTPYCSVRGSRSASI